MLLRTIMQIFEVSFVYCFPEETEEKESQTKYRGLSVKPWSHARIWSYLTWAIGNSLGHEQDL